jgi:hypothetical protein
MFSSSENNNAMTTKARENPARMSRVVMGLLELV